MKSLARIVGIAVLAAGVGCSTPPQILDRVGPLNPEVSGATGEGRLEVATITQTHNESSIDYYPHTSYRIYSDSGKFVQYVPNNSGHMDESPEVVTLWAGRYQVHALSDFGPVVVPVVINPGQTTQVNLQSATAKMSRNRGDKSVVWMPNGPSSAYYQVGFRAR
jgi:hypothetical protein